MSLVGPRPCIPYEYEKYSPAQRARFGAVPGLTGLWQVSGKNRTTFDEMIQLDLRYAATCSLWLDLKILLLTGPALCTQVADILGSRRRNRTKPASPAPDTRRPAVGIQA
jgi:lipopolysaccharide/colanic/teichoic acid biosynthesis glycosyltransferase